LLVTRPKFIDAPLQVSNILAFVVCFKISHILQAIKSTIYNHTRSNTCAGGNKSSKKLQRKANSCLTLHWNSIWLLSRK